MTHVHMINTSTFQGEIMATQHVTKMHSTPAKRYTTRKATPQAKQETLARRTVRAEKYAGTIR